MNYLDKFEINIINSLLHLKNFSTIRKVETNYSFEFVFQNEEVILNIFIEKITGLLIIEFGKKIKSIEEVIDVQDFIELYFNICHKPKFTFNPEDFSFDDIMSCIKNVLIYIGSTLKEIISGNFSNFDSILQNIIFQKSLIDFSGRQPQQINDFDTQNSNIFKVLLLLFDPLIKKGWHYFLLEERHYSFSFLISNNNYCLELKKYLTGDLSEILIKKLNDKKVPQSTDHKNVIGFDFYISTLKLEIFDYSKEMLKENTFLYISNILIHLEKYRDFLIGDSKIFDKVMKLRQSHIENLKNEYGLDIDLI